MSMPVDVRTIAGYELERPIGGGGMGEVWLASRSGIAGVRKRLALKLVPTIAASEHARRRFLDEARVSLLLGHSNIVQVFDVGIAGDVGYIAMEWVEGIDLARAQASRRAEGRPWPLAMTAFIVGEILRGLEYAHGLTHEGRPVDLVHRDISPHNVLLSTNGEVKVADFGIARSALAQATDLAHAGKWKYMAPEQLRRQPVGTHTDLYAVGVILHELLTGAAMRSDPHSASTFEVPALPDDTPAVLVELHRRLLAADPSARLRNARDALTMIEEWEGYRRASHALATIVRDLRPEASVTTPGATQDLDATEAATSTGTPTAPTRTSQSVRTRKRRVVVALAAIVAAGAVAGIAVAVHRATRPLLWRGGCPIDADGDGDLDVVGFVAPTRDLHESLEMVVLDGADGREQMHARGRSEIAGTSCIPTAEMTVVLHDGTGELWGNGRWDAPLVVSETLGGALVLHGPHPTPPADWIAWRGAPTQVQPWPGVGHRMPAVATQGTSKWTARRDDGAGATIEATGPSPWVRPIALATAPPTLARSDDAILTVSTSVDAGAEQATLMVLDPTTGDLRAEVPLGAVQVPTFFVVDGDVLLTDVGDHLLALRISTLQRMWEVAAR